MARKYKNKEKQQNVKQKEFLEEGVILPTSWYSRFSDARIKPILNWFREGKTDSEVLIMVMEIFKVKETSAMVYLKAAKSCFREELILERRFNIVQHVKRYDRDILKLSQYQPKTSSYAQSTLLKTEAYLDMLNLLQRKEKVLGFHKKSQLIKIKNNVNINLTKVERTFDLSGLTLEEKIKLYQLIEKTKVSEEERFTLKPNPNIRREETIDIVHEEVKEEKSTAELIEHVDEPLPPPIPIPKPNVGNDKNVINTITEEVEGKSFEDIKFNILNNLLKK